MLAGWLFVIALVVLVGIAAVSIFLPTTQKDQAIAKK
jgi:hypothetical protein